MSQQKPQQQNELQQQQHQQQSKQASQQFTLNNGSPFHLANQSSIKCKASCGFYGNPEWSGYCSMCYKNLNQQRLQAHIEQQELEQQQNSQQLKQAVGKLGFANIVMSGYDTLTSLHQTLLNTAKSSFKSVSPIMAPASSQSSSGCSNRNKQSGDKVSIKSSLTQFSSKCQGSPSQTELQFSYDIAWSDCLSNVNKFARDFLESERKGKTVHELSDMVHEFYQTVKKRFETHLVYKEATTEQLELLTDNVERVLNEHIYQIISARLIIEDEEHNIAIQKRIKSLSWITVEHLEIDINLEHPAVHDLLDKAICQMIEINSRMSSIDKLECIVQCSKTIAELLNVARTVPVSADQFLPLLVFVVIQANPPMLPADIKYLTRFSNPTKLMSGETGYYFTNLCCALEFIEKASGASLNINQEDFDKYVRGEAVPKSDNKFNTYFCDALRIMCSNDACLKRLKARNDARRTKITSTMDKLDVYSETIRARVEEVDSFTASLNKKLTPKPLLEMENNQLSPNVLPSYLRERITIENSSKCVSS